MSATLEGRRNYAEFDEYIDYQLQKTRQGVKLTDVVTAACGVALLTVSYLLVFIVLDHWVIDGGFGYGMRVALLSGLLVAVLALIGWRVVLPWLRSVTRLYAAKSLEGVEPELSSNLLNYVDLRDSGREVSPTIIRSIEKRAAVTLSHTDVEDAVDRRMLLRLSYGLLGAVVLFSLYTLVSPKKVWPSVVRVFAPWSDTSVSTQTEFLSIDPGEDVEVISGQSLDVSVGLRGEIPETVTLSYTTDDHSFVDETVDMYASEDGLKQFRCTLNGQNGEGLLQSLSYRITANDAVSRAYRVAVKQPPSASVTKIRYDFPDYMEFPAQSLDGPNIEAWEGTRITIEAKTNVPVKRARIEFSEEEQFGVHPVDMDMTVSEDDPTRLSAVWQPVHHFQANGVFPKFYRIQCRTPDGTENPAPAIHTIRIKVDQKPDLVAVAPAQDREVPANAVIPFLAKASDPDFRLSQVVLKLQHGTRAPIEREVYSGTDDRTKSIYDLKLEDSGLILRNGDIVEWWLEARDNRFVEGPDPRNRNQNRVLLEANVAITPRLQLIIREPVEEQEAEEQHKFDREALEEKLDEANDQPNEGEPFSDDGNPPPSDERNSDPENPPRNSDPNNTEEEPAGDENSDDPQNGAEQSSDGDGGKTEGQSGEGTTDGGSGQSGTKPGETGTEEGDTGTSESPDGEGGSKQQRPLSNTGEDDQEVLRELLKRQAENEKGKPQPNAPPNPNGTGDPENNTSPDGDNDSPQGANPDGDPAGNNDDSSQKPGSEGAPNDPSKPTGNDPEGTPDESNDPSNPDGASTPNQEPNPDGSPAKPNDADPDSGTDPKNASENNSPQGDAGNEPKPAETDPESGSGTSNEKPSTPNDEPSSAADGDAGSETQPGNEPSDSDGDPGQDSGSKASDKPGEPGQSPDGDQPQGDSSADNPQDPKSDSPGNAASEKPGEKGSTGSEPNEKPNGDSETGNKGQEGSSGNKPSQTGDSGSSDKPGKSGDTPNGSKPESGNPGQSGSKTESGDSGQSGKSRSQSESGGEGGENASDDKSGSGDSGSPNDKKPGGKPQEGGTSPSDSNSKTGDENSKGSGESNSDSTQSGKTGENGSDPKSEGTPDGEGKPQEKGASSDTDSNSESGNKSSEESQGKSGKSGSSSKSESGQSGKSGKSGSSGKGGAGSGQNGEAGGSSASGSGNPTEGSQTGPPSKSKNPGEGERVVRDPQELDPADAKAAEGAGGTLSDPNPGDAEEAPLEDRLKATNMVLKKLKEDMKRGEVDDALLKKLGWTEKDMQRFVERMDRNLEEPKPNDPRDVARRRQFEESLKSLDLKSSGGERLDQMKNKRDTSNFSDRRLPVPRQYRKAYEDITRRLSRQKKGSGK